MHEVQVRRNSTGGSGYYCKWFPGYKYINPGYYVTHD